MKPTILITGISGFAGQHLAQHFHQQGYTIHGIVRKPDSQLPSQYTLHQADLQDSATLTTVIHQLRPDFIAHLAAYAKVGESFKHPQIAFEVNTLGTLNLFEAIRTASDYHPRILNVGSAEEYGTIMPDQLPLTEDTPLNPPSPYGISKLANYHLVKMYGDVYHLDIVHVRPFNHTGPGQTPGFFTPDMCQQIVHIEAGQQDPIIRTGNIDTYRDISDVRDIVTGYQLLLEKGQPGQAYNLCSGHPTQMKQILDTLLSLSTTNIEHQLDPERMRPSDIPTLYGSNQKITQLGWQPKYNLHTTLTDTLNWWRSQSI